MLGRQKRPAGAEERPEGRLRGAADRHGVEFRSAVRQILELVEQLLYLHVATCLKRATAKISQSVSDPLTYVVASLAATSSSTNREQTRLL